jgi:hypothetical protein
MAMDTVMFNCIKQDDGEDVKMRRGPAQFCEWPLDPSLNACICPCHACVFLERHVRKAHRPPTSSPPMI